jgi:hypothetical protein
MFAKAIPLEFPSTVSVLLLASLDRGVSAEEALLHLKTELRQRWSDTDM